MNSVVGKLSLEKTLDDFEKKFVKKGKFTKRHLAILKEVVEVRKDFKKGKITAKKLDDVRKNSTILVNALIEFTQRCELVALDKGRMRLKHKKGVAEALIAGDAIFLVNGNKIQKVTDKIEDSTMNELNKAVEAQKGKGDVQINPKVFTLLKKELGDFEIVL